MCTNSDCKLYHFIARSLGRTILCSSASGPAREVVSERDAQRDQIWMRRFDPRTDSPPWISPVALVIKRSSKAVAWHCQSPPPRAMGFFSRNSASSGAGTSNVLGRPVARPTSVTMKANRSLSERLYSPLTIVFCLCMFLQLITGGGLIALAVVLQWPPGDALTV